MGAVWAAVIVSAASAAYGGYQSNKAQKENEARANQAMQNEEERRKAIGESLDGLFQQYNELREERPGMTIGDYINDRLTALNNPELKEAFRRLTREDLAEAQQLADLSTTGNILTYQKALDRISNNFAGYAQEEIQNIAKNTDSEAAYSRAMELSSPYIAAGTQEDAQSPDGALQRSNKSAFQTAFEVDQQQDELRYSRLNQILNDDRNITLRQQETAKGFLPITSFTNYATDLHINQRRDQLMMQAMDENFLTSMIGGLTSLAYTDQTKSPAFRDTAVYDQMVAQGVSSAVTGAANIYAGSNTGSNRNSGMVKSGQGTSYADRSVY